MSDHRARAKTHLRVGDGSTQCGRVASMNLLYAEDEEATCRVCNGVAAKRGRKPRTQYRTPDPGPASGLGILKCYNCGKPYRDHPLGEFCMVGVGVGR